MKNRLSDLNNHLFAQLERLSDEELSAEDIEREAARAEAIVSVADQITATADLQFRAAKLVADHGRGIIDMIPETIIGKTIEHRSSEKKDNTATDPEQAEIEERKRVRAIADEREERQRQEREAAK